MGTLLLCMHNLYTGEGIRWINASPSLLMDRWLLDTFLKLLRLLLRGGVTTFNFLIVVNNDILVLALFLYFSIFPLSLTPVTCECSQTSSTHMSTYVLEMLLLGDPEPRQGL